MARAQQWTRNISKKVKQVSAPGASHSIVNSNQLEALKRRAEDLGLIIKAQPQKQARKKKGSRK